MLVLTRKPHQSIDCKLPDGSCITFIVLSVNGNQVRVGIAAAKDVHIVRTELETRERSSGNE